VRRIALALLLALPGTVAAQEEGRFRIEASAGAVFPRAALAERWGTGLGWDARASARLVGGTAVYAGAGAAFFDLDFLDDIRAVDSGVSLGLVQRVGPGGSRVEPWASAGVLLHRLRVDGMEGAGGGERPGVELDAGVAVRTRKAPRLRATVKAGYRRYASRVRTPERESVDYLTLQLGAGASF
jgi:hypothetical protein